jgi:hypothetical protein
MGIGNLETVLRLFTGAGTGEPIAKVVADDDLSYTRVYFGSTPLLHPIAYGKLASFGDDSSNYLWRVLAAREIMQLYRRQPQQLQQLAALHKAGRSAELVLHPPGTPAYPDLQAVERAIHAGQLVDPPAQPAKLGLAFATPHGPLRALRLPALSALLYIGVGTKDIGGGGLLTVTRAVQPGRAGRDDDQLHATGYEFDIARRYRDHRQALAFQFMLDRLQTLNLIAWRRDADKIHVVVADSARRLLPDVARLARDASRQP